ncbi:glyoxalase [Lysobacter oculi]|uniref:Glyoxalase n=1 Tax=Solilutibacter oculi TaxID=2698682 RepID=A0A344J785_9GAMM|nr:VOC family protein [Lysobacter oculi]AXA84895.1 glyoxalase [Lysobacter oculi]
MATRTQGLYINLPVTDLARTRAFYGALGFEIDPRFSDDNAIAVKLGEGQVAMLLRREFFTTFTDRPIIDPRAGVQCLLAIQLDSREAVDAIVEAAVAQGSDEPHGPEDYGFMYQRAFNDPDGHGWGPFWMDPAGPPAQD